MKVLITGATGLIGKSIVQQCHALGYSVHFLTTSKSKIENNSNYQGFFWDPKIGEIDAKCLEGVTAIINLAGSTIAQRWTEANKNKILESRINSLKILHSLLSEQKHSISHIISASAIGIYPSSDTNFYEEDFSDVSETFLGEVVVKWELEADTFKELGLTVSKIRIGLVLDDKEGALPQIARPVKLGLGAAFGNGNQWQSWIHKTDLAAIFLYVINHNLPGVFNGVAPNPVTNSELTKSVARTLKRPLLLPNIPQFIMKLVLGDMHILLFESQRVSSKKIENKGFQFTYANLKSSLANLL
ncbi:TIGR01777 family oxidoreductase [Hanstruepera marina]|uniref:TIGR01777 family oxidoreductase n=1 Tax=Hanstruepera marina TaxID=2873265 RepID=UPI001CA6B779|nr:TIGR01777 family oxidoreductase [Hanstruepera marina]